MNKIAVLKFGGHCIEDPKSLNNLIKNIKYLKKENYKVILVHGGTPIVNERLNEKKIPSEFINGLRVTTKEIMDVVQESILGTEVIKIVKALNISEISSIALNGTDNCLIKCTKRDVDDIDYGYVGKIININTSLLNLAINNGIIPVISPIGCDDVGNSYNINSDYLAANIATSISADLFIVVSNVNGIYKDINDPNSRISLIDKNDVDELVNSKIILPSMETKVRACLDYCNISNNPSYIIDTNQIIDFNTINDGSYGTKVVYEKGNFEIRLACRNDIEEMMSIIKKSFVKYQEKISYTIGPMVETYEDIANDIHNKLVYVMMYNGLMIGTIRFDQCGDMARISRVCVRDDYQNMGYGSMMLSFLEKYAFYKGLSYIGLTSLFNVDYLDAFYKKNGYQLKASNNSRGYYRSLLIKKLDLNIDKINEKIFM